MDYKNKIEESIVEELTKKQNPVISVHHDADGLSSGALFAHAIGKGIDDVEFVYPEIFGETEGEEIDLVLDQAPIDPDFDGVVVDHHDAHFGRNNSYELVYSPQYCTARIVWESLKEKIPDELEWKTAIGIAGDGGEDEIPPELFLKSPEMLTDTGYTYGKQYGKKLEYNEQHSFVMAKSLLNYGTRIGEYEQTMRKLMHSSSVMDIIHDDQLLNAKDTIQREMKNIYKDSSQAKIEVYGDLSYIDYSSDFRLWIAQDMYSKSNKTTIALNKETGSFSVRGPLAQLIARMLDEIEGISAGGHLSYAGGRLETKSVEFLRKQVPILDNQWRNVEI